MIKTELETELAARLELPKGDARELLNVILDEITLALSRNQKVVLMGFGSFESRHVEARQGRNPKTGEPMQIAAHNTVHFRPGAKLKQAVADNG